MVKTDYKLRWYNPITKEHYELPLNDMSIAFGYKTRYEERGMENVEVYSEWNKGVIIPKRGKAIPV